MMKPLRHAFNITGAVFSSSPSYTYIVWRKTQRGTTSTCCHSIICCIQMTIVVIVLQPGPSPTWEMNIYIEYKSRVTPHWTWSFAFLQPQTHQQLLFHFHTVYQEFLIWLLFLLCSGCDLRYKTYNKKYFNTNYRSLKHAQELKVLKNNFVTVTWVNVVW